MKTLPVPPLFVRKALTSNGSKGKNKFIEKLSDEQITKIMTYVVNLEQPDWASMLLTRLVVIHPYLKRHKWFKLELNRFYDAYAKEIAKTNIGVKKITDKVEIASQILTYIKLNKNQESVIN